MKEGYLTEAQMAALQQVYDLMQEHFDACVLAIMVENLEAIPDVKKVKVEAKRFQFHGGHATAVGLASMLHDHLLNLSESHDDDGWEP